MTGRQHAGGDPSLHGRRQPEQADRVADLRAGAPDPAWPALRACSRSRRAAAGTRPPLPARSAGCGAGSPAARRGAGRRPTVSRMIAGMRSRPGLLHGPPAPLAHDELESRLPIGTGLAGRAARRSAAARRSLAPSATSSASASSSKTCRGWRGFGDDRRRPGARRTERRAPGTRPSSGVVSREPDRWRRFHGQPRRRLPFTGNVAGRGFTGHTVAGLGGLECRGRAAVRRTAERRDGLPALAVAADPRCGPLGCCAGLRRLGRVRAVLGTGLGLAGRVVLALGEEDVDGSIRPAVAGFPSPDGISAPRPRPRPRRFSLIGSPSSGYPAGPGVVRLQYLFGKFPGRLEVRERAARRRVVRHDRLPVAGASEIRTERGTVVLSTSAGKCARTSSATWAKARAAVVHGEQDRGDVRVGIEVPLDQLDVAQQLARAPPARSTRTGSG